jgi:ABC-type transport system substrate-binding protein
MKLLPGGLLAGAVSVTLLVAATACSSSGGSSGTSSSQSKVDTSGELTIGTPNVPQGGFNPATSTNVSAAFSIFDAVYGQLIQVNSKTGDMEPDLATSWSWSANHLTLTLNLRHGVKFQDGTPFNAQAVAYFENYYIKSGDTSGLLSLVKTVTAEGPYTVLFTLKGSDSVLIGNLSDNPGYVPSMAVLKNDPNSLTTHPVGAGPYKFQSEESGYDYVLQAWPGYWNNAATPRVQTLRWEVFPTDIAEVNAIKSGAINVASYLDPQDAKALASYSGLVVSTSPGVDSWFGWENTGEVPFSSEAFRRAWEEAINRSALASAETDGAGSALSVDAPGVEADPMVKQLLPIYQYNPSAAAALVKDAGHSGGVNVTCDVEDESSGGDFDAIDPILIADYKAVGINLTLEPLPAAGLGLMFGGKLPCIFFNSDANDNSPWGIENIYKNTAWSQGVFDNPHVDYGTDKYVDAFQSTYTNAGLDQLFYEIERQHQADPGVFTPLLSAPEVNVYQTGIAGWVSDSFNDDHWYAMYRRS